MTSIKNIIIKYQSNELKFQLYKFFENNIDHFDKYDLQFLINHYTMLINQYKRSTLTISYLINVLKMKKRNFNEKYSGLLQFDEQVLKRITDGSNDINAFLMGCNSGSLYSVQILVYNRCDEIYFCNKNGSNGLHIASENGHVQVVKYILEKKLKQLIDSKDSQGRLPFHLGIVGGNISVVKEYLKYYFEESVSIKNLLHQKDSFGKTPLQIAMENHQVEIIEILNGAL